MTIDEAIIHAEEKAEKLRCFCEKHEDDRDLGFVRRSEKCAEEHRQLADWLRELKELREKVSCSVFPNSLDFPTQMSGTCMNVQNMPELPSVQPDLTKLAQELWAKTYLITDNEGLQHQVIHTTDLKMVFEEVMGWIE